MKQSRQKKQDQKQVLYAVMYSTPAEQLHDLDVQKGRLEIAQQQGDLALTQAEIDRENRDAISRMSASGIKARKVNQEKLHKLAMRGLGRRKKS